MECSEIKVSCLVGSLIGGYVSQNILQLKIQNTDMRFANLSAVLNFDVSALQPDLRIL
jgi:hypothetical protein